MGGTHDSIARAQELGAQPGSYVILKAQLAAAVAGDGIAESRKAFSGDPARHVDERIVQAIWHEQLLHGDRLATCSGKPVRVIDPGKWNGEAGPDFRTAELEIGGRRLRGDVEIHVLSSDWDRHRHGSDFEYNNVVLHAFLRRADREVHDVLHNGARIERLELEPLVNPDLESVSRSLAAEDLPFAGRPGAGRCQAAVGCLDTAFLRRFFDESGRERMEAKIARFAAQRAGETLDQVLYQALMTALGHKGSKTLFFLLAKRTPVEELKDYLAGTPQEDVPAAIEAVLLNVANLLIADSGSAAPMPDGPPEVCDSTPLDDETQEYVNRLNRWWSELSGYYQDRLIPPTRRWFSGVRPASFPQRRLAGVARMLAAHDFRRGFVAGLAGQVRQAMVRVPKSSRDFRREINRLSLLFSPEGDSYWRRRFTLGGKKSGRQTELIGGDRASSLLFNALIPVLILHARDRRDGPLEDFLWRLYGNFPALPENSITRFMRQRLFSATADSAIDYRLEKSNQALFQVFHDCCNNNALTCDDCTLRSHAGEATGKGGAA
jgi:hypothetical protein